jgi:uncharacterized lipoprotein YddW (UPF0748 family)
MRAICHSALVAVSACFLFCSNSPAQTNEMRAYWVDAFGAGFKTASEVTSTINSLRAANFNMILPEVRKRADAYYNSNFEPKASDISPTFDPLQDMLSKAHDTSGGKQRIEVHTWAVTYHCWNNQSTPPPQPTHPYNLHPDWLMKSDAGATWDGGNYIFDPGHPEVQRHTYNVAMDLVTNYDIDGFNLDYIRYGGKNWGYNSNTVARFNTRFGRTGQPVSTDPTWVQFRRDQVTALVRKIYLNAIAVKPHMKLSADTITWAPSVNNPTQWTNSARAYNDVLQDWRGWMEEGIIDINIPMNYFRHHDPTYATDYNQWSDFVKNYKYKRHTAIGPALYLNGVSNSIVQMRYTRVPSSTGNYAQGVVGYSYRVTNTTNANQATVISRAAFHAALTNSPNAYDPSATAIFAQRATIPEMPWKTAPTNGHLKGFVFGGTTNSYYDGATVTLAGPVNRLQTNDATGFYGFVDLPPGTYTVTASSTNFSSKSEIVTITAGAVATRDIVMGVVQITAQPQSRTNSLGSTATFTVTATGNSPSYQWRKNGSNLSDGGRISGATTPTLSINNINSLDAGDYSVIVTNIYNSETSANATLTIETALPVIDTQPQSRTNNATTTATFTVSASGSGVLLYQWRKNGVSLLNLGNVSGANTPTLTLTGVLNSDVADYSVAVSNGTGTTTSNPAHLTVIDPVITTQPTGQAVGVGSNAVFTVAASGTSPLSYQWRRNGANLSNSGNISGATTATLTIAGVTLANGGNYTIVVSNSVGLVTSSTAALTAVEPPQITSEPSSQSVTVGAIVSFQVGATGTAPLVYQWRCEGTNIPGATASSFTRSNVQAIHAGNYSVVITNTAGMAISANALLTVSNAAQTVVLSNIWNIRASARAYVTSGTTERGLAIHSVSNHVLIVSRATNSGAIVAVNASTGQNLSKTLNTGGVTGGTFALNKVGVSSDGVVYAANLTTSSTTTPFKIYRWTDYGTAPTVAYSGMPDGGLTARWGDSFALRGSGTNTQIIISGAGGSGQATNAVILTTVDGVNFTATVLNPTPAIAPAEFARGICFGEGNSFYSKDRGTNIAKKFNFDVSTGTATQISTVTGLDDYVIAVAFDTDRNLLSCVVDDNTINNSGHSLRVYNISTPTAPVVVSNFNFVAIGNGTNTFNSNFGGMVDTDGTTIVGLDTQNGVVALSVRDAELPVITSSPESYTGNAGSTAVFSVEASGSNLSYQWRKAGVNLGDGGKISGASSATLTVSNVSQSEAGVYDVLVSNSDATVTSGQATLTVIDPPLITAAPASQTNNAGSSAMFTVGVSGTAPFSYQWRKNGVELSDNENINGSATGTLTLGYVAQFDAAAYSVVVTNAAGSATSAAGTLTVYDPPTIQIQPQGQSIGAGSNATFTVSAAGGGLNYRWRRNGVDLQNGPRVSGVATASLVLSGLVQGDGANYSVVITNTAGSITSSDAALAVIDPPVITSHPVSETSDAGTTASFNVSATGTGPLNYQWRHNGSALTDDRNVSGSTTPTLVLDDVLAAQAGQYTVLVSNGAGQALSSAATFTVNDPIINSQPESITVVAGDPAIFTVQAYGTEQLTYQWKKGNATLSNAGRISGADTATLTITDSESGDAGNYSVIVQSQAGGSVTSATVELEVQTPPSIVTQPVGGTFTAGTNVTMTVVADGDEPLYFQWRKDGTNITTSGNVGGANTATLTITNIASLNAGVYSVVVTNVAGSATSANAQLLVQIPPAIVNQPSGGTFNVGSNATLTVVATGDQPLSYQWRKNGTNLVNGGSVTGSTTATLALTAMTTADAGFYTVIVTNVAGSVTSSQTEIIVRVPPAITQQPAGGSFTLGTNVTLTVVASGDLPLSYQWQKDGTNVVNGGGVSGTATASLTLSNVQSVHSGLYRVVVSNNAGTATSANAQIVVIGPPLIVTQPVGGAYNLGSNVTFSVVATGDQPMSYQWQKNGTNLTNEGRVSGADTATLALTSIIAADAGSYRVIASNAAGTATSANAVLIINTDFTPPKVRILSPANGQRLFENFEVTNYVARIFGTASDEVSIQHVLLSVNNGAFTPATGTSNWSANITLLPGTNNLIVKSVDGGGNSSTQILWKVFYVVNSPLTVNIIGSGQVQNPNGTILEVGKGYKLTAFVGPGTNAVFTNWTSVANGVTNLSFAPVLNFTMQSNLAVTARFITNPFSFAAGSYAGLFHEAGHVEHHSSGFFQMAVTRKFGFSGKMSVDGNSLSFSGKFALNGTVVTNVSRARIGKSNLSLSLALDFTNWTDRVYGTLSDGTNWTANLVGNRAVWTTNVNQTAIAYTNRYAMLIPAFTNAALAPVGDGYATISIDLRGRIVWSGRAADHHLLSQSGMVVSKYGEWPFFVPMYITRNTNIYNGLPVPYTEHKGSMLGWVTFATNTPAGKTNLAPQGALSWIKTGWTNAIYSNGFAGSSTVKGSRHLRPATGQRVLNMTNGTVVAKDGNLPASFSQGFMLRTNNLFQLNLPVANKLKLSVATGTGLMTGSFVHPNRTNTPTLFYGAFLQDYNHGRGYFICTNQSGSITVNKD